MRNGTASANTPAAESADFLHVAPCLIGCEYADERERDLADRLERGHRCVLTVGLLEELIDADGTQVAVSVTRFLSVDGTTETPRVEITGVASGLGDFATTGTGSFRMADLLLQAAKLAAVAARVPVPAEPVDDELTTVVIGGDEPAKTFRIPAPEDPAERAAWEAGVAAREAAGLSPIVGEDYLDRE